MFIANVSGLPLHSAGMNADISNDTTKKLVVTFPANMNLTEAETSVSSKGLTFVPLNTTYDEFQAKTHCAQCFQRPRHIFMVLKQRTIRQRMILLLNSDSRSLLGHPPGRSIFISRPRVQRGTPRC